MVSGEIGAMVRKHHSEIWTIKNADTIVPGFRGRGGEGYEGFRGRGRGRGNSVRSLEVKG